MKKIALVLLAGSLFVFSGCKKTPGPQGPQGIPGVDGNANVVGEDPFTVSSWQYTTNAAGIAGSDAYYASFNDGNVSNAIANNGMVVVYIQYPDGTWKGLPDIVNGTSFSTNFSAGGFDIYYSDVNGSVPINPGSQVFRVVVISSSQRQANPNTNWKNYNEAMAATSAKSAPAVSQ